MQSRGNNLILLPLKVFAAPTRLTAAVSEDGLEVHTALAANDVVDCDPALRSSASVPKQTHEAALPRLEQRTAARRRLLRLRNRPAKQSGVEAAQVHELTAACPLLSQ
mmetsp:Transcript_49033/g.106612  ORF Transcript_49033/g.106612 Transcript_49033/m.106612 type:complete len:108 (+) Transcript_49033:1617-1940(+)